MGCNGGFGIVYYPCTVLFLLCLGFLVLFLGSGLGRKLPGFSLFCTKSIRISSTFDMKAFLRLLFSTINSAALLSPLLITFGDFFISLCYWRYFWSSSSCTFLISSFVKKAIFYSLFKGEDTLILGLEDGDTTKFESWFSVYLPCTIIMLGFTI